MKHFRQGMFCKLLICRWPKSISDRLALSANSWFNNVLVRKADGSLVAPRDFLIRNQFGARAGGPVIKNRTFFFFLYEGQRQKTTVTQNVTVLTTPALQEQFRFFPGVRNG